VNPDKASLKEILREGQEVVVQVDRKARQQGAALTVHLPGRPLHGADAELAHRRRHLAPHRG
jgi:hypothetical protein